MTGYRELSDAGRRSSSEILTHGEATAPLQAHALGRLFILVEQDYVFMAGADIVRIVTNRGTDRVIDLVRPWLQSGNRLDMITSEFSLFAYAELHEALRKLAGIRLILPAEGADLVLLGSTGDRAARNKLISRWLAGRAADWVEKQGHLRAAPGPVPQGSFVLRDSEDSPQLAILGAMEFSTRGMGVMPGNPLNLVQATEGVPESSAIASFFDTQWAALSASGGNAGQELIRALRVIAAEQAPAAVYNRILQYVFGDRGEHLDEWQVVDSATGIRDTVVWGKLYKFQRDAAVAAIDKLNRFGGCIIADSVGLGKTFEALAVIKYFELRNDRVLVLCPKRLRDNWAVYTANDRRNALVSDRFNYDILNHTDLSRDDGYSGDIDLANINWGNYDLVVIDESHNFRNKKSPRQGGETRYDRLMRKIVQEGVRTKVLMLSATPVNNRMADLRNQIAFATAGDDEALADKGIASIDRTTQRAQAQFNSWLKLDESDRTPGRLITMLGFDYFTLLDQLTIARSRRHIERYYDTTEVGQFPERLKPLNYKPDIDLDGDFSPIEDLNLEIKKLSLGVYAPMQYVLPHKRAEYEAKYETRLGGGKGVFRQVDRELSLVNLMRVNILKRLESSVHSFALTVDRMIDAIGAVLDRIDAHAVDVEEPDINDIDIEDPDFEPLLLGRRVKVLLADLDRVRLRQDLSGDRERLRSMLHQARRITPERDAKLHELREVIAAKCAQPINPGNRKVIVFTAFADTAVYLYEQLSGWAKETQGMESALVTGAGGNRTTLPRLRRDLASVLSAFSPRSKERAPELAVEGGIDLLIATDCISEGQNLQDCDWLVNYDIHWNPVAIVQRFGRIDRLGSPNSQVQLVNFWPNMELEEYINLERRVSGRMVLLDISATGEENLIARNSGDRMNDLEYRRKQLLRMQDSITDLEDLGDGISITDMTLTEFRIDLAEYLKANPGELDKLPLGVHTVVTAGDVGIPPGIVFCLRAEGDADSRMREASYPLAPYYLLHMGDDGGAPLRHTQVRQVLERLRYLCARRETADPTVYARHDKATRRGRDMRHAQDLLQDAIRSITGRSEERAIASLFTPGGTHATRGEFAGIGDFEVMAFVVILPEEPE